MMATVDFRQRTAYLFLAVIVGHVILISAQVNTARGVPMLEAVVFGAFAEVAEDADALLLAVHWSRVADVLDASRRLVPLDSRYLEPHNGEAFVKDAAQMAQIAEFMVRILRNRTDFNFFAATNSPKCRRVCDLCNPNSLAQPCTSSQPSGGSSCDLDRNLAISSSSRCAFTAVVSMLVG